MKNNYYELLKNLHMDKLSYYRRWYHTAPMVITPERDAELEKMQQVLYKACEYYVHHYKDYLDIIPYEKKVLEILEYAAEYPFKAGTMRPDYIICSNGSLKFCEITSRFYGHIYYTNIFPECIIDDIEKEKNMPERKDRYKELLNVLANLPGEAKEMYVLKSADKTSEIQVYVPFYEALGLKVHILEADEVEAACDRLAGCFVVSALNQFDILSYSMENIRKIIDSGCRNDMRTVFLLHDKRFFRLFDHKDFTSKCLTEEETEFLRSHTITTYLYNMDREVFEDAAKNKDGYIIKPAKLGKSENVFAGELTSKEEWERIFSGDLTDMILQPFEKQKLFPTVWEGTAFMDYICGAVLNMDDKYYGLGMIRTSSCPVINRTDDRKIAPITTDQYENLQEYHLL